MEYSATIRNKLQGHAVVSREGHRNPLQYSCLQNPVNRGAWWAAVHGVAQSRTRLKRLSMHACIGEGNGNPLRYSCLEIPRDRGAWWAAVHGVAKSRTRLKRLSRKSKISPSAWPLCSLFVVCRALHFTDDKMEVQCTSVTCPRPPTYYVLSWENTYFKMLMV